MEKAQAIELQAKHFVKQADAWGSSCAYVIACSKAKSLTPVPAGELYTSSRFRNQLKIAKHFSDQVFVLSAKYGILGLDETVAPYDVTFPNGIFAAGAKIPNLRRLEKFQRVVSFGGGNYSEILERHLAPTSHLVIPFKHLNSFDTARWGRVLQDLIYRRETASEFYGVIQSFVDQNGIHSFESFTSLQNLPRRGVYFFFDPDEETKWSGSVPRIVRIGTHAVSIGSKSTLRTRLRAHFGQKDRSGNHRASIFRLHVGNALIQSRSLSERYPNWGQGMSASKEIRAAERSLEIEVSEYLGRLLMTYVELSDLPGKQSQRSQLENSAINFLGADMIPIDEPSPNWLGRMALPKQIRETGLWNIQHNGLKFDRTALKNIVNIAENPILRDV
ncbi:MAG: hypothetical protein KDJ19_08255 [Hyphomicrobiaceae bacterium]|nr:hypothetical protein [Hyphomicrobiaceae bacterium]MCC0023262.1 hypothetical protein [Hyphomicrobiaceae bacterium]